MILGLNHNKTRQAYSPPKTAIAAGYGLVTLRSTRPCVLR